MVRYHQAEPLRKTQMAGYARIETQRAHRIVPERECDGGGVGEDDGRKIEGRAKAKGAMLEKYGSLDLRISGRIDGILDFRNSESLEIV